MKIEVPLSDTVTAGGAYNADGDPVIVGDPPIWKDESDATYANYAGQYFGAGNPSFTGSASAVVDPSATSVIGNPDYARVFVRARLNVTRGSNAKMPEVRLEFSSTIRLQLAPQTLAPTVPTWVDFELQELGGGNRAQLMADPSTFTLNFRAPIYDRGIEAVPNEMQRFSIYEAHLYVITSGDAPPCRMWARDDELALGGARIFPPARSQQRSSRGVGYY